jgi:tight adherence protein C
MQNVVDRFNLAKWLAQEEARVKLVQAGYRGQAPYIGFLFFRMVTPIDLLLICVESGMSIEAAFKKVSQEIGSQSVALAEELTLTTAELSYLQDRKMAYENLAMRTDLEGVRSVCMALQQAERYGTPLAQTLRVMAQENRDMRMSEAEKKAAALPPKLTVPMILFFLPVLFIVILGPAAIRVMAIQDTSSKAPITKSSAK